MEKLVELGLTKSIGVSNFNSEQLTRLLANCKIKPIHNQVRQLRLQNFKYCNTNLFNSTKTQIPICAYQFALKWATICQVRSSEMDTRSLIWSHYLKI